MELAKVEETEERLTITPVMDAHKRELTAFVPTLIFGELVCIAWFGYSFHENSPAASIEEIEAGASFPPSVLLSGPSR